MDFKCLYCGNSYKRRDSLTRHMRVKHSDVPIVKNMHGAGKNTESTEYQCCHCDSDFTKRTNLERLPIGRNYPQSLTTDESMYSPLQQSVFPKSGPRPN